jgi:hypothetical protein
MVVGRDVKWVVGGTTDRPALGQDKSAIDNFVVNADRVFTDEELKTIQPRVSISRIILDIGKKVRQKKQTFTPAPIKTKDEKPKGAPKNRRRDKEMR